MGARRGFTLIELLVVIAIIAILAAILFPVFISAKAKAQQTVCAGNLKQIALATSLYMDSYNNRYPAWYDSLGADVWFRVLYKYSKAKLLAKCPADGTIKTDESISYWKNAYCDRFANQAGLAPALEGEIKYRKTAPYLMDGPPRGGATHNYWGPPRSYLPRASGWGSDYAGLLLASEKRHGGAANVLFCDWHVRAVRPDEWQTSNTATDGDPLDAAPVDYRPTGKWRCRADGVHPWFRPN
jgi:prepilin-type N-terminal cleavage/methylation domain-containing protein/prepilin-type processing-associated H-X9-DG protein